MGWFSRDKYPVTANPWGGNASSDIVLRKWIGNNYDALLRPYCGCLGWRLSGDLGSKRQVIKRAETELKNHYLTCKEV